MAFDEMCALRPGDVVERPRFAEWPGGEGLVLAVEISYEAGRPPQVSVQFYCDEHEIVLWFVQTPGPEWE